MKFQFKEGQWFDVRKLTDWQKQWCLENLDFTKYAHKLIENGEVYRYRYKGRSFMSTSPDHINSKDELTFNDFYWGMFWDEDEEVPQKSIFDNPRWVTLKHTAPKLTQGKDYKVVGFIGDGDLLKFTVVDDDGCESNTHFSLFHKVTPQDLLPEEVEDSFDNLILTTEKNYFSEDTCFVLFKDTMSTWQKDCLKYKLKTFCPHLWEDYDESLDSADVYIFDSNGLVWGGSGSDRNYWGIEEIYFNDIFQEVN